MSVKVSGAVWDADLPRDEKYVLLALADHASHDGRNVRPSLDLIEWKTGYDVRQVRRIVRALEDRGVLVRESAGVGGRGRPTHYAIALDKLPVRVPFEPRKADILSGFGPEKAGQRNTGEMSGFPEKADIPAENPDISARNPDIAMSGEPSEEPSREPSKRKRRSAADEPETTNDSGPKPWDLLDAVFRAQDMDPTSLTFEPIKAKQLAIAKRLLSAGLTAVDVDAITRWLLSQGWITEGIDLFMVEKSVSKWVAAGRPFPRERRRGPEPFNPTTYANRRRA